MKKSKTVVIRFPLLERFEQNVKRSKPGDKWTAEEVRALRKLKRVGERINNICGI